MLYCCFSQSLQTDESDLVKKNEQAQSIQLGHNKVAGVSADQPLTDINRSHLSHVKDPKSSDDQPLLLGCGSLADATSCIIEACQLLLNNLTNISCQSLMSLKKHYC